MPPIESDTGKNDLKSQIQLLIDSNQVMVFSKSYCPYCVKVKDLFNELKLEFNTMELDLQEDGTNYQDMLLEMTGQKSVPNVFINKTHVGGCDKTLQAHKDGSLQQLLCAETEAYDYDLIVIGGGSGGLACSKDARKFGWEIDEKGDKQTREGDVLHSGKVYHSNWREAALPRHPRRQRVLHHQTLVIGASYVALECGGFLAGLGLDVTVMVRSILLRGFDQEMANRAGEHMEEHGVKFLRKYVPIKVEELEAGSPGRLKVTAKSTESDEVIEGEYNTVLIAVGRDACTDKIGLDKTGVKVNPKTGKVPVSDEEQTNVPHIYAVGDILEGKWELTPVAIQAGRLLARRLYGGESSSTAAAGCLRIEPSSSMARRTSSLFWPLEFTVPNRDNNKCYAKIICNKLDNDRVIGFHYLGPNAGEVTQGFGTAMKVRVETSPRPAAEVKPCSFSGLRSCLTPKTPPTLISPPSDAPFKEQMIIGTNQRPSRSEKSGLSSENTVTCTAAMATLALMVLFGWSSI
ncbi:hypothetical protein F7725_016487 [Dissostichus mawsoni]|uniref:Thioredoxin-disulfide reductase n=1 Tax=Dissostichus mawsoni TaxID=36200 RepID=A0A7J5Z1U9_DISMA|nr:hypothetical protein F7725_016487 [Dissostichus mawsoni]